MKKLVYIISAFSLLMVSYRFLMDATEVTEVGNGCDQISLVGESAYPGELSSGSSTSSMRRIFLQVIIPIFQKKWMLFRDIS
jgi:hypothetical protein